MPLLREAGPTSLDLGADVVIVGGGLAGAWSAIAAARAGGKIVLVDKGHVGTSGVMASAGVGHWWVPPDPELRSAAIDDRYERSLGLGEKDWMSRVLDLTWQTIPTLKGLYAFPSDEDGGVLRYRILRGPEYGRALRRLVKRSGVTVLDHSPALELLVDDEGHVAGVSGWGLQSRRPWTLRCGAVVLATGGTAFKSFLLGSHVDTGDGALMAAEAGAELSGMEFSGYYTPAPAHTTMTRSMSYMFGTYSDGDGQKIEIASPQHLVPTLAQALLTGPVFAVLDRMPEEFRRKLPSIQPNFKLGFDRLGIDPFRDRFEITLRSEGTIRGTGGLRVMGSDCQTSVAGLFAAGDVATRELVAGATSGGGAQKGPASVVARARRCLDRRRRYPNRHRQQSGTGTRDRSHGRRCSMVLPRGPGARRNPRTASAGRRTADSTRSRTTSLGGRSGPGVDQTRDGPKLDGHGVGAIMIEVVLEDRCTRCNICVKICPTNVFDVIEDGPPAVARQQDCQTCFLCEVYCPADALFVAPQCDATVDVDLAFAAEHAGQYRRDSGWGVWRKDPEHRNEVWRMDLAFERAFELWETGGQ